MRQSYFSRWNTCMMQPRPHQIPLIKTREPGKMNWVNWNTCILRIPPTASWLPIPLSHIGSQVKRRQSQYYKFKEFAKIVSFLILKRALHATHLLKLLDKMCKYEMDPMSIVQKQSGHDSVHRRTDERLQWNWLHHPNGQAEGRADRQTRWNQCTPLSTSLKRRVY